jgi:tRNA(Ile2) C34 agmatinyltransferase TiaS
MFDEPFILTLIVLLVLWLAWLIVCEFRRKQRLRCYRCGAVLKKSDEGWYCQSCRKRVNSETVKFKIGKDRELR